MPQGPGKTQRISITLPQWLIDALNELINLYQVSRSEIIRNALIDYLKANYPQLLPNSHQ